MDKSWITVSKTDFRRFFTGAKEFAENSKLYANSDGKATCPCKQCQNAKLQLSDTIFHHIVNNGFDLSYKVWIYHGEQLAGYESHRSDDEECDHNDRDDGVDDLLRDAFPVEDEIGSLDDHNVRHSNPDVDQLFVDMEKPLFDGCEDFSVLSFLLKLMHIKVTCKMTNQAMDSILQLLTEAFKVEQLPRNHYEAKKYLRILGLGYESIHACENDCALFWKEHESLQECPICRSSRWVEKKTPDSKKIAKKVLRYFPVTSRLKRLFSSRHSAKEMRWHKVNKSAEEGVLRHPSDGEAWKHFDRLFPDFAADSRNVRLGLASDGFNPFGAMSLSYSMWPVVLIPYNMPPWRSLSEGSFMMSLLIPGPNSPGRDIDVYLRPLIDELKTLWATGAETYDCIAKERFNLRAALMWTVNDFPAYGYLSGWSTSGYKACPTCNKDTCAMRLRDKLAYVGHRRFLPNDHPWRRARDFNGKTESRTKPNTFSGEVCLQQMENIENVFGKTVARKRKRSQDDLNWSKCSIFFELPYWKKHLLRHNIDVMHVEKNVCDNLLGTLLDISGKTKDTEKARLDLEDMRIRPELHLVDGNGRCCKPSASYVLTRPERIRFCQFIKSVRFPHGFAGNLSKNVMDDQGKISGLKSHDCHILLQRLLPIGIRPFLSKKIRETIIELCQFFEQLTSRTLSTLALEALEEGIVVVLCKLERIFPPAFFTIMVHLCVHLPREALLGGPVHSRWMYPIERYLGHLKKFVRNRARPEGSIAEGYIVEEAINFASQYLRGVNSKFSTRLQNDHISKVVMRVYTMDIFRPIGKSIGKKTISHMSRDVFDKAVWFVLNNCAEIQPYIDEHKHLMRQQQNTDRQELSFAVWFQDRIGKLYLAKAPEVNDELYALSCGPDIRVTSYSGYEVNGVKFLVKSRDDRRKTQNSGVSTAGTHDDIEDDYFGFLEEVIELSYIKNYQVILFKCRWLDTDRRNKHVIYDQYFISLDTSRTAYKEDPFIFASQARQVFYVEDPTKPNRSWKIVQRFNHRHLWDMPEDLEDPTKFLETPATPQPLTVDANDFNMLLDRHGEPPDVLDNIQVQNIRREHFVDDDVEDEVEDDTVEVDDEGSFDSSMADSNDEAKSVASDDEED